MKNPNELRSILISKRVFIFLLTAIVAVFPLFLVGCAPYNATIVSGENLFEATPEWEERVGNIHTRGTYYPNPDYDPEYDPLKDENGENA
ncbi:MAG: hypothetical protein IJ800_00745, partial [Clostridia bacterium]|nr:hypothetical protein [Clostridia bacterium]